MQYIKKKIFFIYIRYNFINLLGILNSVIFDHSMAKIMIDNSTNLFEHIQ